MGTIIFLSVIFVLWIGGALLFECYDTRNDYRCSFVMAIILAICAGIIIFATLVSKNARFQIEVENHLALQELVEYQRLEDISQFERFKIVEQIHKSNKIVNRHRILNQNFWVGLWYSEEVGNLPYIK